MLVQWSGLVVAEDMSAEVEEGEDGEGGEPADEYELLGVGEEIEAGGLAKGSVEEDVLAEEPERWEQGPEAEQPGFLCVAVGWSGFGAAGVGLFAEEVEGSSECVDGEEEARDGDGEGDFSVGVEGAGHALGWESFGEEWSVHGGIVTVKVRASCGRSHGLRREMAGAQHPAIVCRYNKDQ